MVAAVAGAAASSSGVASARIRVRQFMTAPFRRQRVTPHFVIANALLLKSKQLGYFVLRILIL